MIEKNNKYHKPLHLLLSARGLRAAHISFSSVHAVDRQCVLYSVHYWNRAWAHPLNLFWESTIGVPDHIIYIVFSLGA